MTLDFNILSTLIFLPLLGVFLLMTLVRGDETSVAVRAKHTALWFSIFTFLLSLILWYGFDYKNPDFQYVEKYQWFVDVDIAYHLGVDGISLFLIVLNCLLMPICILASWNSITFRVKEYMIAFLLLQAFVNGVFASLDLLLFYIFFEGMLIPMYLIIGIWGGDRRVYASFKFFLYTLLGSVLFLIALLFMFNNLGTTDIPTLMQKSPSVFNLDVQKWLWLALFASFAVKVPMWPFHTWLPDAHVQAPTAGSVILAGILLKMGGYGFIRLSLPMLPDASVYFIPLMFTLSIIAIIYTSLVALAQTDMKKMIAYSSVAHMGFVTLGIFALNNQGIEGAIFQMISHGLVSGALFLCVGVLYERLHTKEIAKYGGVTNTMPKFAALFMVFTLASVGLPATSGFVGEFLSLMGAYMVSTTASALAATGVVLGAAYMLWLYRRIFFGEVTNKAVLKMRELTVIELSTLAPLAIIIIILGIYPKPILSAITPSVNKLITQINSAQGDVK